MLVRAVDLTALIALPSNDKTEHNLYLTYDTNFVYRYDAIGNTFVQIAGGGTSGSNGAPAIVIITEHYQEDVIVTMYALIKDDVVVNVIVADLDYLTLIADQYDEYLEVTDGLVIGMGYRKNSDDSFMAPEPSEQVGVQMELAL